jgi:DNA gyrase inhibitor GyrI
LEIRGKVILNARSLAIGSELCEASMSPLYRAFGVLALAGACISAVLGLMSLPPGGLMFALPYFFFGLAIALAVVGGVCLVAARGVKRRSAEDWSAIPDSGAASEGHAVSEAPASPKGSAALEVDIVRLEPMTVAAARAVGDSPERDAWEKLRAWAEPGGLLDDVVAHPVFGFNNPNPSPGRSEYGYEYWIRVEPDADATGEVEIKDFAGGRYAVTRCRLVGDPSGNVMEVWQKLWDWVRSSDYEWRRTHELEKLVDPRAKEDEVVLDLYLPIED